VVYVQYKCNEELYDLYSSPNIILVIKSRRKRHVGRVAQIGEGEVHAGFWWGSLNKGDYLEDLGVDGRIILKWIFKRWNGGAWAGLIWLGIRTGGSLL
jgi:hypothetical protein